MVRHKERINYDSLPDEQLANLAATVVFILLGERALHLLCEKVNTMSSLRVREGKGEEDEEKVSDSSPIRG